jgi:ArsR family transcriptional regulator
LNTSTPGGSKARASRTSSKAAPALKISDETIGGLTEVFKMLADKSRLRILLALAQDGELHVSALCGLLGESQPAVSHHLALLRMQGLVAFRRDGKHNFYRVASGLVRELLEQFFADAANGQKQLHFGDFSLVYKRK